jgi:SAM-dependent methyltransferase
MRYDMRMWQNRERALSFGSDAARYDRARPGYPAELVDDLMVGHPWRVLDIGCGTGKAGRLLVNRGCQVLGVEPDDRMAAVARTYGLDVDVAPFERWDAAGRHFDLAICAQAWHWIEPVAGLRRVAGVLRPGDRFAIFWNHASYVDEVRADLDRIYERIAPQIADRAVVVGNVPNARLDDDVNAMTSSSQFTPPDDRRYTWSLEYPADDFLDLLRTHSDHMLLPDDTLATLLDEVKALVAGHGGALTVEYRTRLLLLTRRA